MTIGGGVLCIDGEPVAKLAKGDLVVMAKACLDAMQGGEVPEGQQGLLACYTTVDLQPVEVDDAC